MRKQGASAVTPMSNPGNPHDPNDHDMYDTGLRDSPSEGDRAAADLVSVIVPCYNQGMFLAECLGSVAAQDYSAIETVVVDDGSDAATKADIAAAAEQFRFRLVTQENRGLSAARNAGLAAAQGRFVLPLDADNRLAPDAVRRLVAHFIERHQEDARVAYVYQDKVWFGAEDRYVPHSEYNLYVLMQDNFSDACALIDRTALERHGLAYDESMRAGYEDWELFLRMAVYDLIGTRLAGRTFYYRRWGFSMVNLADERRAELIRSIRRREGALYFPPVAAGIKRAWAPGVTVLLADPVPLAAQTLQDRDARLCRTEADMMAALPSVRGKYWFLVTPGQEGALADDPALLHKLIGFLERQPQYGAVRVTRQGMVAARLILARRLLGERPELEAPTFAALDKALDVVYRVPTWDVDRQTWSADEQAPVEVPAAAAPRRWARWLKDQGKRRVAPRIGFERAAGIYFHQRQALLLLRRPRRQPAPAAPAPERRSGFPLVAAGASEPGHQAEAGFRHWLSVNADAPAPLRPPLKAAALHAYRQAPVLPAAVSPRTVGGRGRALMLGYDGPTLSGLQQEGWAVTVADLRLAALGHLPPGAAAEDLALWTPAPVFDGVAAAPDLRELLGPEVDRLAHRAMKPKAWAAGGISPRHPPRVLLVAPCLVTGGADRALLDLVPVLAGAPFDVYLATTEPSPNSWLKFALPYVKEYWDLGALGATDPERVGLLAELTERWGIDAVYVMHSRVGFDALPELRRHRRVPVVAQFHLEEPVGHGGWVFYGLSRYANLIDRVASVSHQLAERVATGYYFPRDKIRTIHLGAEVPAAVSPAPRTARLQVLYPARLAEQKAPLTLVAIGKVLKALDVPVAIHVLGDGPLRRALAAAIEREHLGAWIELHDFVPAAAMPAWYARAHATLLTSAWEGLPLVLLESLGAGRPVVAPDVGAVRELVSPATGVLVSRPDRVQEYADALIRWAANPEVLPRLGLAGRRLVQEDFDPQQTARAYLSLFDELW